MPQQQTFMERQSDTGKILVIKTYDAQFAREAFDEMDTSAREQLARALKLADKFDLPFTPNEEDIWEEVLEMSREDWNSFSFFVVQKVVGNATTNLYITPDWPSAEEFAQTL